MVSAFETYLNNALNIIMPLAAIGFVFWMFYKPFKLDLLFGWIGRKLKEWRENREASPQSPIDRLKGMGDNSRLVFE